VRTEHGHGHGHGFYQAIPLGLVFLVAFGVVSRSCVRAQGNEVIRVNLRVCVWPALAMP
jgi:hypothetical protein